MNILLLTSAMTSGGTERVAATLANAWSLRGGRVTLMPTFSARGECFYELGPDVRLVYLADLVQIRARTFVNQLVRLHALRRFIMDERPDVIISFLPNVNVAAILSSAFLSIPLIICERSDPSAYPYSAMWQFSCMLTYRFADMLTVQTSAVANKVWGIYPGLKRVRSIPNPLAEGVHRFAAAPERRRKILLSLGRLSGEKQLELVIDAFAKAAQLFDDWDLHIYGDGPVRPMLEARIIAMGMEGRVLLKGQTSDPWQIMSNADAFVMFSRCEGFPNALVEAMGVGLPCISSDCPSGPGEITRDGRDALLVPLNDSAALLSAMAQLFGDAELRATLGKQARESVRARYSLLKVIEKWDHLFREVGAIR
jgi:GalNAc-alpha-(1->4)-GalNAc-alpha-(1->3)-diNAcBac-PP-undecaprenol alpha-1,4-N-acetyl-D-galactosaminyltransferase